MSQRTLERRVGVLILVAVAVLGGFVVVMAGVSFEPQLTVHVELDDPGGLKPGAPVKLSGVKIGEVTKISFQVAPLPEASSESSRRPAWILVSSKVDVKYRPFLHDDSRWQITAQNLLGEPFLAVSPGSPGRPVLSHDAVVRGSSLPRLDLLIGEVYSILHLVHTSLSGEAQTLSETLVALRGTLQGSAAFFEQNGDKLTELLAKLDALSVQSNDLVRGAREKYVEDPRIERILASLERSADVLSQQLPALTAEGQTTLQAMSKIASTLASDQQLARYQRVTADLELVAAETRKTVGEARQTLAQVRSGRGTAGALIADEALYDDLQELVRDLRQNPWKLLWRE